MKFDLLIYVLLRVYYSNRLANLAINKRAFFVTRVIRIIANLCESTNWISSSFNRSRIILGASIYIVE